MIHITPRVAYYERDEWGARTDIPRLGGPEDPRRTGSGYRRRLVPRDRRTHIIQHHTVIIDDDATPNLWETTAEVFRKMRQLQTIRPDLGLDVPYNFVGFLMAASYPAMLIICEGRGFDRSGAHTAGQAADGSWHNVSGLALALEGNFELGGNISPWMADISAFWTWVKAGGLAA